MKKSHKTHLQEFLDSLSLWDKFMMHFVRTLFPGAVSNLLTGLICVQEDIEEDFLNKFDKVTKQLEPKRKPGRPRKK